MCRRQGLGRGESGEIGAVELFPDGAMRGEMV